MDNVSYRNFMLEAYQQMLLCEENLSPKVGAVLVLDGVIVAKGYKTKESHAERLIIESALNHSIDLRRTILFTTLEPCVSIKQNQKRQSCSDLIIQSNIKNVYIGSYDDHPNVYRKGWKALKEKGILLNDFDDDIRIEIEKNNSTFIEHFSKGIGPKGGAKLFHKDGAKFEIQFSENDKRTMNIEWTLAGINAAYCYAVKPITCANALYAKTFDDIDNPAVFKGSYSARVEVDEIGIFSGPEAFILVKPKEIKSGPDYGDDDYYVNFEYEVRLKNI